MAFQSNADGITSDVVGYDQFGLRGNGQSAGAGASFLPVDGSDLMLGDITVTGYDTTEGYADFQIQAKQLNGFGVGGTTYYWVDATVDGTTYFGWYNDDGSVDYNDVEVAAGEGLWIYSPSTFYSVVFPSPIAE